MRRQGGKGRETLRTAAAVSIAVALAGLVGCAELLDSTAADSTPRPPSPVEVARSALAAGNLDGAETALAQAMAPADAKNEEKPTGPRDLRPMGWRQKAPGQDRPRSTLFRIGEEPSPSADAENPSAANTPRAADLLELRAELRIRQARYSEAEADALAAMALLPATPSADVPPAATAAVAPRRAALTQRGIHMRIAHLYEDAARDDDAERHIDAAAALCNGDATLVAGGECDHEREALVRIRMARGHYAEAEPLVLAEIADVQSRYGAYDIRLSFALCHVARFYARQGKYSLSGPLYARSFDLWKTARDEAFAAYTGAAAASQPGPFDAEFLRPGEGHAPFASPCGLEDQPALLYKLGKAQAAADAMRFEQHLWADDTEAGIAAVNALDALVARKGDVLDIAAAHHAVAFVARKKGDTPRAEQELRAAVDAYTTAWPTLSRSEKRYRTEDYLSAIESLVELLRSTRRFAEAIPLGERADQVASDVLDAYDAVRLDTLLSLATTYREMREPEDAEASAGRYLDAVVKARGDTSADYAWALRTISFAYLLRDELDASQRMEMQAKAIWAKQSTVAPEF